MIQDIINKAKKEHKKVYIYAHNFPDGDAISSSAALVLYLENQGIDAKYIIQNPIYSFKQIVSEIPTTQTVDDNSISIILDTSTAEYCENTLFLSSAPENIYIIDHHKKAENAKCIEDQLNIPNENVIRNSESSSTSEILLNEFEEGKISPTIANILTLGLITDTARLQFLKENTLENLTKLISLGVNYEEILSLCTRKSTLREEVGLAKLFLGAQQVQIGDTFGLILSIDNKTVTDMSSKYLLRNLPKKIFKMSDITNCSFTCISAETKPNEFDLEFRSTPIYGNFDVQQLAVKYGGGGHLNAAGCHIKQKAALESLIPTITSMYSNQEVQSKTITLTDLDLKLSQLLQETKHLTQNITPEILIEINKLIKQGANYDYAFKKLKPLERFMLENELLNKIPESSFSQKQPIVSIYLSKQESVALQEKYYISEEDILNSINIFSDINIKFATISISGGKKVQIDKNGNITTGGGHRKNEKVMTK